MDRTDVDSKMFKSVGYNADTQTMELEFTNGNVYRYTKVKQNDWDNFRKAESKGRHFAMYIRGHFPHELITPLQQLKEQQLKKGTQDEEEG
jgi:hypothetical protein